MKGGGSECCLRTDLYLALISNRFFSHPTQLTWQLLWLPRKNFGNWQVTSGIESSWLLTFDLSSSPSFDIAFHQCFVRIWLSLLFRNSRQTIGGGCYTKPTFQVHNSSRRCYRSYFSQELSRDERIYECKFERGCLMSAKLCESR